MHAIEVTATGGPEVLKYVDTPRPSPGPGEVLIKAEATFVLGAEIGDTVEARDDGVTTLRVGDRVATADAVGCLRRILHCGSRCRCARARRSHHGCRRGRDLERHDSAPADQVGISGPGRRHRAAARRRRRRRPDPDPVGNQPRRPRHHHHLDGARRRSCRVRPAR